MDRWPESELISKNCFGMIEWKAVREAASRFLPKHTAAAAWKHRNVSFVEREGLSRIAVQSKETLMAPWSAAWPRAWWQQRRDETSPHGKRRATWVGVNDSAEQQPQADHAVRWQEPAARVGRRTTTSSVLAQESSLVLVTRGTRHRFRGGGFGFGGGY